MLNYDEAILRNRGIDPAAPFPVLHQALRIALYNTFAARAFHARVIEAFGARPPFEAVLRSTERHSAALSAQCQRFGVPRPLDPFSQETRVAPGWLANCQRAALGELANIRLYQYLLTRVVEPEVRTVLTDCLTDALEDHLPAFRQAALDALARERYHAAHGIPPEQAYVRHGAVSDLLEKVFAQIGPAAGPLGYLGLYLRHLHPAMLAGLVSGGAGVYWWKNRPNPSFKKEK